MTTDPWAWAATGLALVAVWLLLPPPSRVPGPGEGASSTPLPAGRAASTVSLGRRVLVGLAAGVAVAGAGGLWVGWPAVLLGLLVGSAAGLALGRLESSAVRRRRERSLLELPQVLDLLASGLSAGLPLRSAAEAVIDACPGAVAADLDRIRHLIAVGMGDVDAWRTLRDHPQLGPVAVDLARSVETGTHLVSGLSSHASDARIARRAALEIRARRVGVLSVAPLMLCFIPAFLLLGVVPTVASALLRAFDFS